jgi:hypothetical protein
LASSLTADNNKKNSNYSNNNNNNSNNKAQAQDETNSNGSDLNVDSNHNTNNNKNNNSNTAVEEEASSFVVVDDPRSVWTAEEDLRLLRAIEEHGLGNWPDIAEAVAGPGSVGKTPKRCMERYLDDFLGRYGYILPPHTLVAVTAENNNNDTTAGNEESVVTEGNSEANDDEAARPTKRRAVLMRSPSSVASEGATSVSTNYTRKTYHAIATESLPEYEDIWSTPFLPVLEDGSSPALGDPVGRDQAYRAEMNFVRSISTLEKEQAEQVRKEWKQTKLNKPGGPTVLPMRPDDVPELPGSELLGFMPRRGDFDVEWDNEAEQAVADMEFIPGEPPEDRNLKLQVLTIYNSKLDERERRKQFIISRKLYDYRKHLQDLQKLPRDERDLVQRMRLFERFHTPIEHEKFIADLLKAKRLRKEIAKLQMYRRMGIRSLLEAERYELDKARRQFHKNFIIQKESETNSTKRPENGAEGRLAGSMLDLSEASASVTYWKQYRTTDRKLRRSINRSVPGANAEAATRSTECGLNTGAITVAGDNESEAKASVDGVDDSKPAAARHSELNTSNNADITIVSEDKKAAESSVDVDISLPATSPEILDLSNMPGFQLLSLREVELCKTLRLQPEQYIEIKKALIYESLTHGLLEGKSARSNKTGSLTTAKGGKKNLGPGVRRTLVKIDVERRGAILDFVVRAGWISTNVGDAVRSCL